MKRIYFLLSAFCSAISHAQTTTTLVPLQSVWKYLDNGSNQGTAWRTPAFDDTGWAQGPAQLGYGDGDEATVVSYGPNSAAKYITTYFRRSFAVSDAASFTSAGLRLRRDDGVVIYLNGTEIYRTNLPAGTVTYTTLAPAAIGGADESALLTSTVNSALLVEGNNVLAVEMHQNAGSSSDLTFDMELTGTMPPAQGAPVANPQSTSLAEDTSASVTLTGSDPEGSALTYSIVTGPSSGSLTGTPPALTYTPAANFAGTDSFTFKVNDGTYDSAPATVSLTITQVNDPPSANAQTVSAGEGTPVSFTLTGSDLESRYGTLPDYTQQLYSGDLTGIIDGLSGATWNADTGTLFFIRNVSTGAGHSYEYTADGTLVRTITQSGFQDTEAIAWMYGNTYAIAEENDFQRITICTIPPGATTLDRTGAGNVTWNTVVGSLLNLGVESLCYDAGRDLLYYLSEKPAGGTWNIYAMNPATGVSSVLCDLNTTVFTSGVATDLSDIAFDRATDTLICLSHESNKVIRVSRAGSVLEQKATSGFTQAEAVALTPDRLRLFIGGEPKQFARYVLPADTLTYTLVSGPANGTLTGLPPLLTYTPAPGFRGTDTFTFSVSDGTLTTAPATVTINVDALVAKGSAWKYLDNGSNQGTAWRAAAFDDTAWAQGPAQLGYGDGDEAKVIGFGPDANNKYVTSYFRREFQVADPNVISGVLKLDLLRDDGAIVYLNGTEIVRSNMPAGAVAHTQLASANISAPDESTFYTFSVNRSLLVAGRNVLAAEVHQGALNSADLSFDLRLYESMPSVSRGPYIQMTGTARATVRWRTDVATTTLLNYGTDAGALNGSFSDTVPKTEHVVTLTGLTPDTRYYYAAGHSGGTLVSGLTHYFVTHPPAGTSRPYRFWVLGDPGTGDGNQRAVRDAFYAFNGTQRLDGVLMLGDNVYETGTDLEFQTKMFEIYPTMLRNTTFWPTFGNHDAGSASSATQSGPYYDLFTLPKLGEAGGVASGTEAYYSFDHGNIHFVCLDSEGTSLATGGTMANWLRQDLAANVQEWIVAYWHHPPYCRGTRDSDSATLDGGREKNMREVFVPIFEDHGVDLLLFGHEHNYQRSKFIDGHYGLSTTFNPATMLKQPGLGNPAVDAAYTKNQGPHNGAVYAVAGSSGKLNTGTFNHPVMAVNYAELGSVVIDVNGRELQARFLNSTGVVRDNFTIVHNAPPEALAATITGAEDAPLAVTLTGTDAESDPLTYEILTSPVAGILTGTAPDLVFTPPANFAGQTSFEFRVNDGRANSAAVTVTLVITPVNDAPLATGSAVSGSEDIAAAITLTGTDIDGDALTFAVTSLPAHGTLMGTAPDLIYTPDANWNGTDSFTFTVSDAAEISPPALVSITVAPVNDAPAAAAQSVAIPEDTGVALTLTGTDAEGDALSFAITSPPAHGTLTGTAPDIVYWPNANYTGPDSFVFTASDGAAVSNGAAVNITMLPVNDAPGAVAQTVSTDEDTPQPVTLTGTDVDGDALTFTVTQPPAHGTLSGATPNLTFTPDGNYNGTDSFSFIASDGTAESVSAAVSLIIAPVNDTPVAAPQTVLLTEDTPTSVLLGATDADGDTLTWAITAPPAHGTLSGTLPQVTYSPDENWYGTDSFAFTASDAAATSAPAVVSLEAAPVNDAPVAAGQSVSTPEGTALPVTVAATDADGDVLGYTLGTPPVNGTLSGTLPGVVYTPNPAWQGTDSFTFRANDGTATSVPAVVSITVTPANDAPAAVPQSVATVEDTVLAVTLTGTDADGDALSYAITEPPSHGVLSGVLPAVSYTPDPDWNGADNFSFTVNDGAATSAPADVAITVTPVNDDPVAAGAALSTAEDTALPIALAASDIDGDALTFSIASAPARGTLSGSLPDITYTPDANWSGSDSFSFNATDGTAISPAATVTLTVTSVNDAPVAATVNVSTEVGVPVSLTLNGSDAEGDPLTWAITVPPAFGTLSGSGTARTYTPNLAWSGTDQFWFTVSDGSATSPATPATITVASSGPWQLVARTGLTAPGASGATFTVLASDFVSDAAGRASFRGTAGSVTGLWTEGAAGLEALAAQGAAAPGVTGAVFDAVTTGAWAAGDGEVLLFGKMLAGPGGVTTSSDLGYWLRSSGAMSLVARENNPVPGLPAAARFNVLSSVATLQAGGNYAFAASVRTNSSLGITSANDTALWATFGAPLRLLVRENDAAPGASGGLFDTLTSASLVSNDTAQLGFATSLKVAGSVTTANRYGLWLWDPLQFGLVARGGNAAPGTPAGAVFAQPQQPALGGSLSFRSTLATGTGGVTNSIDTGIWALEAGGVTLWAREGFQAPGIPAGGLFNNLTEGATVNAAGELAFRASLRNGGGVASANNAGLWVRSRFTGDALTVVARKGAVAPGAGSATFASFDMPFLASDGGEVFTATLTSGTGGVTSANDRGLWLRSAAGSLALALREGAAFTVAPGDIRTVAAITLPAAPASGRIPLSDEGRLLVLLNFTDGSSALYHYVLP